MTDVCPHTCTHICHTEKELLSRGALQTAEVHVGSTGVMRTGRLTAARSAGKELGSTQVCVREKVVTTQCHSEITPQACGKGKMVHRTCFLKTST